MSHKIEELFAKTSLFGVSRLVKPILPQKLRWFGDVITHLIISAHVKINEVLFVFLLV